MATPFFGKRDADTPNSLNSTNNVRQGPASTYTPASTAVSTPPAQTATAIKEGGSKLTVGPNIKLKGVEITDCDTLVVEGTVEATMDSRVIQIMANGAFKGSADIDIAEIHGQFDGNLTVRDKLVIYAQGKVNGTIRYGKVIIEEGGQLSGDVQFGAKVAQLAAAHATAASAPKMGIHASP